MPIKPIHASSAALPSAPVSFFSDPLAWVVDLIKQIGSCSMIGSLATDCFSEKGRFTIIQYSLIGATGIGVVGSIVILISGLPAVGALVAALSVATGTGAWMAYQAADQWALTQSIDEIKKQADVYVQQNKTYQKENRTHRKENRAQRRENDRLNNEVTRAAENNVVQERQIKTLRGEVVQHQKNNAVQAEQITQLGDEVDLHKENNATQSEQIGRLEQSLTEGVRQQEELRQRNQDLGTQIGLLSGLAESFKTEISSMKAGTKKQREAIAAKTGELAIQIKAMDAVLEQHQGELGGNLLKLKELIDEATAERLTEQGALLETIQTSQQHLQGMQAQERALSVQVVKMEGQLKASNEYLAQLKEEHRQILEESKKNVQQQEQLNGALRQDLTALSANITGSRYSSAQGTCAFDAGFGNIGMA